MFGLNGNTFLSAVGIQRASCQQNTVVWTSHF